MLFDEMRAIQHKHGYLPAEQVHTLSKTLGIPLYQINGVAEFYPEFRVNPPAQAMVEVCTDMACHLHGAETLFVGELTGLGGDGAGNLLDLFSRRQIVLDDDELAFQLARDLEDGRQDHEDRPVLLAGGDRRVECLNDLDGDVFGILPLT